MTTEAAEAYREGRERISATLRAAGEASTRTEVPACPGWTPKDVVSHLTGVCADILAGNLDGVATNPWTAAQVEARRSTTLADVLGEWADVGPQIEALLPSFPEWAANQLVFDLLSHEHDIADALGLPAPANVKADGPALEFAAKALIGRAEQLDLPRLNIVCGERTWASSGQGEGATLTLGAVELLRSVTGRRTAEEVQKLDWNGSDPVPWLPAFEIGVFKLRDTPLSNSRLGTPTQAPLERGAPPPRPAVAS
ncbi:MAG TPA: maleylpyruvate isomerase family mycothiol-dependent enzyme [Acidimicrobiales bacterium]|nr:maleylpyruvate isomerase family mycothiol-dependent enzyme [Acidimicrobiales bacterium]